MGNCGKNDFYAFFPETENSARNGASRKIFQNIAWIRSIDSDTTSSKSVDAPFDNNHPESSVSLAPRFAF